MWHIVAFSQLPDGTNEKKRRQQGQALPGSGPQPRCPEDSRVEGKKERGQEDGDQPDKQ